MSFVHDSAVISESQVGEDVKLYANTRIKSCKLGNHVSVGDASSILESTLGDRIFIQRYNDIIFSEIGRYTCTGRFDVIHCATIGAFTSISWDVSIGGDNHDPALLSLHPFYYQTLFGMAMDPNAQREELLNDIVNSPCVIGNDVWIAAGVKINRNVRIGNGTIIGANSTVTHDIPPYSVAVGSPARVIKKRFDDAIIGELEQIEWWTFPDHILKENIHLFKSHVNAKHISALWQLKASLSK